MPDVKAAECVRMNSLSHLPVDVLQTSFSVVYG